MRHVARLAQHVLELRPAHVPIEVADEDTALGPIRVGLASERGTDDARRRLWLLRRGRGLRRVPAVLANEEQPAVQLVVAQRADRSCSARRVDEVDERVPLRAAARLAGDIDVRDRPHGVH